MQNWNIAMDNNFDLNLLPIAVVLYEERSVSRTAKSLGMSQPAVSKALAKMRLLLNDELFVRTSGGMVPTRKAQSLLPHARELLTRLKHDVLAVTSFNPTNTDTMLTFALSDIGELGLFPQYVKTLLQLAPHVQIRSVYPSQHELRDGLQNGNIDLAVGMYPELETNSFSRQILGSPAGIVCVMRTDRPTPGNSISLKEYLDLDHVVVNGSNRTGPLMEDFLRRKKLKRKVVVVTTTFASLAGIIESSNMVATVVRYTGAYLCRTNKNLKMVSVPFQGPGLNVYQYWHRSFQNAPRNQWLRKVVKGISKLRNARPPEP
jgi:DNA-binding transcriptional LysR family regulator